MEHISPINEIITNKILSDEEVSNLEGNWIDEYYLKYPVITKDTDVYYKENGSKILLLKFRKNVISDQLAHIGWNNYKDLAKASRGRGASAGPINVSGTYWSKRNIINTNKWSTGYLTPDGNKLLNDLQDLPFDNIKQIATNMDIETINKKTSLAFTKKELIYIIIQKKGGVSNMKVNNQVASNPIGFIEEMKNMNRLPCRLTHFTRTNFKHYQDGLPFIQKIDELYRELTPDKYEKQLKRANLKPLFKIPGTSFSTVTINRNFRTALHKDGGDYEDGFGNLTVLRRGKYQGGYTIFPQFGIAVDVDTNDYLAMDVHQYHANTPIYETDEDKEYNASLPKVFTDNPDVGTEGIYENYTRLTFVCYLRSKLIHCDEKDPRVADHIKASGNRKIITESI